MKTKTPKSTPKLRSKAAKITALRRSAGAKLRHHRRRHKKLAYLHFLIVASLLGIVAGAGGVMAAMATNLIPPPRPDINMSVYERAIAEQQKQASAPKPPDQVGVASWYALGLHSPDALTCASTRFPRGTYLQVTDLRNNRQVTCLVNDYGPTPGTHRVIDLSRGSYSQLEGLGSGTLPAEIRVVSGP